LSHLATNRHVRRQLLHSSGGYEVSGAPSFHLHCLLQEPVATCQQAPTMSIQ